MKKFTKEKWFPIAVVAIVAAALGLVMALFGWCITYAMELKNSWDAVSAIATWCGVIIAIISAGASFAAVWYTIKISDKQKKIDLFDKRYNIYKTLQNCNILFHPPMPDDIETANFIFLSVFDSEKMLQFIQDVAQGEENSQKIPLKQHIELMANIKCKQIISILRETKFLFAKSSEIVEYTDDIAMALSGYFLQPSDDAAQLHLKCIANSETKMNEILKKIEQFLQI